MNGLSYFWEEFSLKKFVCYIFYWALFLTIALVGVNAQILDILEDENPLLRVVCIEVSNFDESILDKVNNLEETLEKFQGAGLAANQVGYNERLFVVFLSSKVPGELKYISGISRPEKDRMFVFINPIILEKSGEQVVWEGCLSLPGVLYKLIRPMSVLVKAYDASGNEFIVEATGFWAKCICHEYDHLDGILCKDTALEAKANL